VGSTESYQPPSSNPEDNCDDEEDLLFALFGQRGIDEVSGEAGGNGTQAGSCSTEECSIALSHNSKDHPTSHYDEVKLSVSEVAVLDLLILCDSSSAHCGFYDDLIMLLRKHIKNRFAVMKTKGRDSFLKVMRKKVPTPLPRITKVAGHEVIHFSFLEMLCDMLISSRFQDVNNLCINR
jgi:hypothetical protein